MTWARREFGLALLLVLIGGTGALLVASRVWQTAHTPRVRPLADDVLDIGGRTIDAGPTALALVALAGVVAVLATRGLLRRAVGAVLALAGAALLYRSAAAAPALDAASVRELVRTKHSGVGIVADAAPRVVVHGLWPALSICCGVLVLLAGLLVALRGHRWAGMSARYDAPGSAGHDAEQARGQAAASMWTALDRGEDPTD